MLVRSLPRISRTGLGLASQSAKHSYHHPHPHPHPHPHSHAYTLLHPSSQLHHALSSLPLLSCHSFRMLHSASASASTYTSTSTSTSTSSPFLVSRCFPVRSFSTEGPRGASDAGADGGGGRGGGGFWSRFGRRGKPEPTPQPQPQPQPQPETEAETEGEAAGKQKPNTTEEEKAENPYGDGFKEKFGGKKVWKKVKKVIKWGIVLMFTYYAITDHPNVEGEAWYITILLKPYRTVMAMFPGDDSILIPAETPDQFGRRTRTLVVNWENVLVSSDWGRAEGWSVRQRPGLDQFLARAYKAGWEIVVFCTATQEPTEQHILRADPTGGQIIKHRIFYEGTSFHEGFIVKDLDRLGRDLERVIAVDYDTDMYRLQRANLLKIKKFSTDKNDKELEKIAEFLENLSRYNVHDVRPYIAKFNANPADPTMFAEEEQARMQAAERLRKAKRSMKYTGAADTTTITPKTSTNQTEKEEQGWFGWVKGITGVFSRP